MQIFSFLVGFFILVAVGIVVFQITELLRLPKSTPHPQAADGGLTNFKKQGKTAGKTGRKRHPAYHPAQ